MQGLQAMCKIIEQDWQPVKLLCVCFFITKAAFDPAELEDLFAVQGLLKFSNVYSNQEEEGERQLPLREGGKQESKIQYLNDFFPAIFSSPRKHLFR